MCTYALLLLHVCKCSTICSARLHLFQAPLHLPCPVRSGHMRLMALCCAHVAIRELISNASDALDKVGHPTAQAHGPR